MPSEPSTEVEVVPPCQTEYPPVLNSGNKISEISAEILVIGGDR